jgi:serine/threonine-protein kinase
MAKLPDQRFQTAAEFREAISGPAERTRRSRGRILVGAVLGAVVLAFAAVSLTRSREAASMDAELLAVAPFDVVDPALSLLGEGLVDVVSRSLDGAGALRTVSPSLVIRRWSGRADPLSATQLGHATGAGLAVVGQVVRAGPDSIRLSASVFDVIGQRTMGDFQFLEAADRIDRIADSLTVGVLRLLGRARRAGTAGFASLGTPSLPAGKAFLRGEQLYRHAAWDSAVAAYQEALSLDTSFALAYNRAAAARGWAVNEADPQAIAWKLRAAQLSRGLSPRDSLRLLSDSLRASIVRPGPPDVAQTSRTRRQFELLQELTARYPDDAEMWYALGDAYFHGGLGPTSVPVERTHAAFDRAIELDSAFAPAYLHLVDISFQLFRDTTRALWYADRYVAQSSPGGAFREGLRLVASLLRQPPADSEEFKARLQGVRPNVLVIALRTLTRFPDRDETALRMARVMLSAASGVGADPLTVGARYQAAEALARRGRLIEAHGALGSNDNSLLAADAFALGVQPPGSAAEIIRRWTAQTVAQGSAPNFFALLPWLSQHRDTAAISGLLGFVAQLTKTGLSDVPVEDRANVAEWVRLAGIAADGFLALARGDTTSALRRFETLPDSSCTMFCAEVPLATAQLLVARGRYQEADSILARRWMVGDRPTELLFALERGRVSERLDDRDQAIEAYTLVIDAWENGDSLVQPVVEAAREGLRRLGEDERVRRPVRR